MQVTENVIEHRNVSLQQPEQGQNVPNKGLNHQKMDEQNVENPKDTKNGVENNSK